ncbi:hypothetical protein AVEN_68267-1 [Araneus ventricosus]|uniref:Uncharacterized protein n=1 Tax=Araneus ventricosus TaxID=182803 RepID=A0A4Y2QW37_ARAVE|nr:hypothetical protein AVEN_68267-1 [Araneus ventricosus]
MAIKSDLLTTFDCDNYQIITFKMEVLPFFVKKGEECKMPTGKPHKGRVECFSNGKGVRVTVTSCFVRLLNLPSRYLLFLRLLFSQQVAIASAFCDNA